MSSRNIKRTFELLPAKPQDIPRLAQIHVDACALDPCIQLKFPVWDDFQPKVEQMLKSQIGQPNWTHVKAVDSETEQIAAWASWVTIPVQSDLEDQNVLSIDKIGSSPQDVSSGQERKPSGMNESSSPPYQRDQETFQFLPGLGTYVQQETDRFISTFMCGKAYNRCKALFTDPAFQKRGIGRALMEHGSHLADEKGLSVILWATPSGFPVYTACEFQIVGKLEIDLKQWDENRKTEHAQDVYTIRFMQRTTSRTST